MSPVLSLDDGRLKSGEARVFEAVDSVRVEEQDLLADLSLSDLSCVACGGHLRRPGDSVLDEVRFVTYSLPDSVKDQIETYKKIIESLSGLDTFQAFFGNRSQSEDPKQEGAESS